MRRSFLIFPALLIAVLVIQSIKSHNSNSNIEPHPSESPSASPTPVVSPSPSPKPSPKPLSFIQMNQKYGPCVQLPVLMYHHIQTKESATANKQVGLSVYTDIFRGQMQYLKDKGYMVLDIQSLQVFFDQGSVVPKKSILITFDDAYKDFYTDAYPILKSFNFKAVMFTPTGLVNNPGYLSWDEINQMPGITFANHTWSHKNVGGDTSVMEKEISTADIQLKDHGLNSPKSFAYPYGLDTAQAETYLSSLGYVAAFSTQPGNILCKGMRFDLPRVRIGNSPLSSYGF